MANSDTPLPWTGVTEGRIVHVRRPGVNHCTPAIVTRYWADGLTDAVNVLLFPDGGNDQAKVPTGLTDQYVLPWETSVHHDASPEHSSDRPSWHWPERV